MTDTFPTLVFADDGSLEADRAWLWVNDQSWPGWVVEAVTCVQHGGLIAGELDAASKVAARRPAPTDLVCESFSHHVVVEDPRLALVSRDDAALVVVGQRGHGTLKRLHLGSTAEYLVHHLTAPVVVAKRPTTVRTVVVATDGSEHSNAAVDALLAVPWIAGVEALHVVGVQAIPGEAEPTIAAAVDDTCRHVAGVVFCSPKPVIGQGSPADSILAYADRVNCDLLVVGTRGQNLRRLGRLWGSTARGVIEATTSSVLVAHAGWVDSAVPDPA